MFKYADIMKRLHRLTSYFENSGLIVEADVLQEIFYKLAQDKSAKMWQLFEQVFDQVVRAYGLSTEKEIIGVPEKNITKRDVLGAWNEASEFVRASIGLRNMTPELYQQLIDSAEAKFQAWTGKERIGFDFEKHLQERGLAAK